MRGRKSGGKTEMQEKEEVDSKRVIKGWRGWKIETERKGRSWKVRGGKRKNGKREATEIRRKERERKRNGG